MLRSESIKEITAALITFQGKMESVIKDGKANYGKYATLAAIQDAIKQPLLDCGLGIVQMPDGQNCLTTLVSHTSGEWIEATYEMKPTNNTPQGIGSCITYQRRYALAAALNICIDDDDDGQKGSAQMQTHSDLDREIVENDILLAVKICKTVDEINAIYKDKRSTFKNQSRLIEACAARKKELSV